MQLILGSGGLEVFKQYGKDERWNVVWRFVAGLTKFKHVEGHFDDKIAEISDSLPSIMQCLFEAQAIKYFVSYFKNSKNVFENRIAPLPPDTAYGYCIANILTGMSFSIFHFHHHVVFNILYVA